MKVLLVNGSPKANGCTHAALAVVAGELAKCGIDTEIFWCGNKPIMAALAAESVVRQNVAGMTQTQ